MVDLLSINFYDWTIPLDLTQHYKIVVLDCIKSLTARLTHDNLRIGELFSLLVVTYLYHPGFGIEDIDLPLIHEISINIDNIRCFQFKIFLSVSFDQVNWPSLMIQTIMAQSFVKLCNQYIVTFQILEMSKRDIDG